MSRKFIVFSLLVIATLILSACTANININLFTAEEIINRSFDGVAVIDVEMFNGGIDVVTGSGRSLDIKVTKRGGGNSQQEAQADLKNVEVTFEQSGDAVRVIARRTDRQIDIGNSGASATLTVPEGTRVELRTSNGGVASAGPVGAVVVRTSNAGVSVKAAAGPVDVETSNGQITITGGRERLSLRTSNGGINASADDVSVQAHTSNGEVRFSGSLADGSDNELETSNAGVIVTLPAAARFTVDAGTSNGSVKTDFEVRSSQISDSTLRGTVGDGGAATTLVLKASNGNIDLRQSR